MAFIFLSPDKEALSIAREEKSIRSMPYSAYPLVTPRLPAGLPLFFSIEGRFRRGESRKYALLLRFLTKKLLDNLNANKEELAPE